MAEPRRNGRPGYEASDATLRPLLLFFGGLAVLCVVVFVAMVVLFNVFQKTLTEAEQAQTPSPPPLAAARQLPVEPRLQYAEPADLEKYRGDERGRVGSYGWVDRDKGIVRLPVARALELLVQRGLPLRLSPASVTDEGGP
jgi:uncharacterized membrane protein